MDSGRLKRGHEMRRGVSAWMRVGGFGWLVG